MPNLLKELKSEITRLARKEAKQAVAPVKKASANYRGLIAGLRKQIDVLQKEVAALRRAAPKAENALASAQEPQGRFWITGKGVGPAQAPGAHAGPVRQTGGRQRAHDRQLGCRQGQGAHPAQNQHCQDAADPGAA